MAKSMALNSAAGLSGMLKDGHKHYDGIDGATMRNIDAAKHLSTIVSSSLGPHGMNKLVVNHLDRIIVTSDCATIVRELEVQHPAAKMLQLAAEMQDSECGDGTNLTVSFAGQLLTRTEELLRMGLHTSEIIEGYKRASTKLFELLPTLVCQKVEHAGVMDVTELTRVIRPVIMAKQLGCVDVLAPLVAQACIGTMNPNSRPSVSPEAIRVAKIMGGDVSMSSVISGMVVLSGAATLNKTSVEDAVVAVFGCGIEASATEAKGTVLMKNAEDLQNYNKTEETKMDEIIKSIASAGVTVVVSGGSVSEMALHFMEQYGIMCLKIASKWELRRLCSAVNATALVRLGPPTPEEMGFCDLVKVQEIGGRIVTLFTQTKSAKDGCRLSTVILRASTSSLLADLERAVDDGVHACKNLCKDGRLVPGAGATEMELSLRLKRFADTCPGLDQYAIRSFAKAMEFVPKTLAENSGQDATDLVTALGAAHAKEGGETMGVDVMADAYGEGDANGIRDTTTPDDLIVDLLTTKTSAFRLGIDAALTVLRVDQIIMSKPAGGGKQ